MVLPSLATSQADTSRPRGRDAWHVRCSSVGWPGVKWALALVCASVPQRTLNLQRGRQLELVSDTSARRLNRRALRWCQTPVRLRARASSRPVLLVHDAFDTPVSDTGDTPSMEWPAPLTVREVAA